MRNLLSLLAVGMMSVGSAQAGVSEFSGVYQTSLTYDGYSAKIIVGASGAGNLTGGIYYGLKVDGTTVYYSLEQVKVSASKVSSDGSFSGTTLNGIPFSGKITVGSSSTTFRGTITVSGVSIPFSGNRVYK